MGNKTENSYEFEFQEWKEYLDMTVTEQAVWVHKLFTAVMVVIFVAGVCGNLLTCVVIYCDRSMHTATNYYLFNLAVADLLMAFGILLELDGHMNYEYLYDVYDMGDFACKLHYFLVVTLWNTDILTITALAVERYIVIFHPFLLNSEPSRRLVKVICLIWITAIFETLPETWTLRLARSQRFTVCWFVPTPFTRLLNSLMSLVTFVIPLVIMLFVYTMIAWKVKEAQTRYSEVKIFNLGNKSSKVSKLVLALTVSFVICWLPFFWIRFTFALDLDLSRSWIIKNWDLLMMMSTFNSWFSIVLNPLLFNLMSTKFRKALKKLWNTKMKRNPNTASTL